MSLTTALVVKYYSDLLPVESHSSYVDRLQFHGERIFSPTAHVQQSRTNKNEMRLWNIDRLEPDEPVSSDSLNNGPDYLHSLHRESQRIPSFSIPHSDRFYHRFVPLHKQHSVIKTSLSGISPSKNLTIKNLAIQDLSIKDPTIKNTAIKNLAIHCLSEQFCGRDCCICCAVSTFLILDFRGDELHLRSSIVGYYALEDHGAVPCHYKLAG